MNLWKVLGLAGVAGVAAAGVIIAQEQRQRAQLSPEEIRARLHERLEQAPSAPVRDALPDAPVSSWKHPRWLPRRQAGPLTGRDASVLDPPFRPPAIRVTKDFLAQMRRVAQR